MGVGDSGFEAMSVEQMYGEGWTPAEAADHVPDIGSWLAKKRMEVWGRVGNKAAAPSLVSAFMGIEKLFPAKAGTSDPVLIDGQPVFDIRIFPILYSPRAAEHLNGLSLGEAFRCYVVNDCEVRSMSGRILEICPRNGLMFVDGRFPGTDGFHWRLNITSAEIASGLLNPRLASPQTCTSDVENAVSCVLAARIWALTDRLAWGHIAAVGTFAATGVEGLISRGQWRRQNIWLDVCNSDICELRDGRYVAIWTGVVLRAERGHSQTVVTATSSQLVISNVEPARSNPQSTAGAESQCGVWLKGIIAANPEVRTRTNESLLNEARLTWPNKRLSKRAFDRALAKAIGSERAEAWGKGGRPKKTSAA
jgi:hypothetical protein